MIATDDSKYITIDTVQGVRRFKYPTVRQFKRIKNQITSMKDQAQSDLAMDDLLAELQPLLADIVDTPLEDLLTVPEVNFVAIKLLTAIPDYLDKKKSESPLVTPTEATVTTAPDMSQIVPG